MPTLIFTAPKVTLLYAGIMALAYFALSVYVIRWRWKENRGLGFANDPSSGLFRAVRIHGNFMEFVPFTLLLIALDEMTNLKPVCVHWYGGALIVARILHFFAIRKTEGPSWQRVVAMFLTFALLTVLGVSLILKGIA